MNNLLENILAIFEEINTVPRKSKQEEKISAWLVQWARSHGLTAKQDNTLNVIIYVPATPGREKDPTVVLQGHMDMVCEKTPASSHDFSKDAVKLVRDGNWLRADKTSLGADNGVGMALALALAVAPAVSHPALELLMTSDEETGLNGVKSIDHKHISGSLLINLDSENEGVFTIGCAGGRDIAISLPLRANTPAQDDVAYTISIDGLHGGHSGIDIHEQRENANIVLARILNPAIKDVIGIRLAAISGGSAHNAIPRNARAVVHVPSGSKNLFRTVIDNAASRHKALVALYEPALSISVEDAPLQPLAYTIDDTRTVIDLILALPHGVAKMSADINGLVETSNNLATLSLKNNTFSILSSQRSSVETQLDWIVSKVESVARLAGATYTTEEGYPGWEPNVHSPFLALCKKCYTGLFGKEPHVEAIHAGLECGIIGAKFGNMDMISLGPTIKNPHSPNEKLYLPSVPKVWDLLVSILKEVK